MVTAGEFREDLYYRINVIELRVPALRDRGDDIIKLAEHILGRLNPKISLDESARQCLSGYAFPGNVCALPAPSQSQTSIFAQPRRVQVHQTKAIA
jgi:transcriptional regulator with PAS, ATPase and Fis domain